MRFNRIDTGTDYRVVCRVDAPLWFQLWMASLKGVK